MAVNLGKNRTLTIKTDTKQIFSEPLYLFERSAEMEVKHGNKVEQKIIEKVQIRSKWKWKWKDKVNMTVGGSESMKNGQ